ncbi:hypothetical protein V1514DRAFT_364457 [Lipomyces japonicus]|uniref:uncharacterized protein n=1 Tax=Lipomyces japonicus TaxID=56871 RepID=UPI0034CEF599
MHFIAPTVRTQLPAVQRRVLVQSFVSSRAAHDLAVTLSGKPVVAHGPGGRSSRSGYVATVFGATGFIGRYLTSRLAKNGTIVVTPYREEIAKRFLKVTGDLGVVNFVEFDLRNLQSIEDAVKNSDIVYNLIGREYSTKLFDYYDINVEATRRIANAVAKYNVDRFIQVSSYNASPDSTSEFWRTKYEAEQVAKEIVPHATIVRPAPVIGWEDRVVRRIIGWPHFTVNEGQNTFQPVHVEDLVSALHKIGFDDSTTGKTYELFGPDVTSWRQLIRACEREAFKEYKTFNIPKSVYASVSDALNKVLWWPVGSADQVERLSQDQVVPKHSLTFADLGIKPQRYNEYVGTYVKYLRSNLFQDVESGSLAESKREREFIHVAR